MNAPTLEDLITVWQSAPPNRRAAGLAALQGATAPAIGRALTISGAARALGVSRMTIHRAIYAGTLRTVKPYAGANPRITEGELRRWMGS